LIFLAFGGFWWYPRLIGTMTNFCCACCCHISAVSLLFGGRLNPFGKICSYNLSTSTYKGDLEWEDKPTYQDDANKMLILAVVQLIFWCVQCCCCCIPLFMTPVKDKEYEQEKKRGKEI